METKIKPDNDFDPPIAVIGIGCLFPRSRGPHEYWRLLLEGEDAITDVPDSHWAAEDYFDPDPRTPDHTYCKRGGFLAPLHFDPTEFGIPPNSLEATDTSQLLALVAAKTALEDAGYGEGKNFARERTSVILGVTGTQELVVPLASRLGHPRWRKALQQAGVPADIREAVIAGIADAYVPWQENSFPGLLGNVVAGRICNRLNLGGTNCVVDAACASSMGAVHLALMELYAGRSEMVITGGVDTLNDIFMHMCFAKTRILSPSGDIRPFSREADGTLLGEGIGLVVLKRLADARRDGDRVYAVLRGIGSASDGRSQSIYAPRKEGQMQCLQSAYARAGIEPATVALVEAHGTGTRVGDKVEFEALKAVFPPPGSENGRCALGSVKSMIGHTKAAAGAAGLIKTILALHHKVLPPTLKVDNPDPELDIENSPFYLNTRSRPWFTDADRPRRAGVSAFGFGGSNFHVVLEESQPEKTAAAWDSAVEVLALSADSREMLLEKLQTLAGDSAGAYESGSFSFLAAETRAQFSGTAPHRWLWAAERTTLESRGPAAILEEALLSLRQETIDERRMNGPIYYGRGARQGSLAFLFPGQGSQYPDMGRDLVCRFPEAFAVLQNANRCFTGNGKLTDWIYPQELLRGTAAVPDGLADTRIAQPAIGAVSLAMLRVLQRFAVQPQACAGHSFGELTALLAAGRLPEQTFLELAAIRGRLMAAAGSRRPGGMTAVHAPLERIEALIAEHELELVLANRNAPDQGVVSGTVADLEKIEKHCRNRGFRCVRLPVSAAFHSPLIADALQPFQQAAAQAVFEPGPIPVYANATADVYPAEPSRSAALLADQLRQPVRFFDMITAMHRAGVRTFLEIGPRRILSGLTSRILADDPAVRTIALDASGGRRSGFYDLACGLCALAAAGYSPDLQRWGLSAPKMRPAKMQIRLTGANYVAARKTAPTQRTAAANCAPIGAARAPETTFSPEPPAPPVRTPRESGTQTMKNNTRTPSGDEFLQQALAAVQQGMQTMQALQEQTAKAHEKFLETQREASRTLQMMMDSTRRLTLPESDDADPADTEHPPMAAASTAARPVPAQRPVQEPDSIPPGPAVEAPEDVSGGNRPESLQSRPPSRPERTASETPAQSENPAAPQVLLEVVSELTGYPIETIDPDMDIEADLGIDSIKRVEILSALEERLPGLPSVPPDVLGRTRTLKEIGALLHLESAGDPAPPAGSSLAPQPAAPELEPQSADSTALMELVLEVVSELTGYPTETIDPNMDIEADLGIDSIKRVEILSAVEERMPGLTPVAPEVLGRMKSLAQIVEQLNSTAETMPEAAGGSTESAEAETPGRPQAAADTLPALDRYRLSAVERQARHSGGLTIPAGRKVFITEDGGGFAQALADCLTARGIDTMLVSHDILRHGSSLPAAGGLILAVGPQTVLDTDYLKALFELTRNLAPSLMESADAGGALFASMIRLDGGFGCCGNPLPNPLQGSLAGLTKTAALEWEGVRCRALDVSPQWDDMPAAAEAAVAELLDTAAAEPAEAGLDRNCRRILEMEPAALENIDGAGTGLENGDVVIISGGARGVAAAAACALAATASLKLVLLGRTAAPVPEPDWLKGLEAEAEIKKAILAHEFSGNTVSPRELETAYARRIANRQVARTLKAVRNAGSEAHYVEADVRNAGMVSGVVARLQQQIGPVRALIHAAGILQDRLIVDKSPEQFETVVSTKVDGLLALLQAVDVSHLKHLVLFSSVAGRLGNRGQADYAMGNEAINKIARQLASEYPQLRVRSINWGPWDGGMVQPALRREFERRGIDLIPVDRGAAHLVQEMAAGDSEVEVVVGAARLSAAPAQRPHPAEASRNEEAPAESDLSLAFQREIDTETHPVLRSHVIAGRPVVPLALMAEWFGQSALHENPGLSLQGLEDMRVLKGIDLNGEPRKIRLLAGKALYDQGRYQVHLELRDDENRVLHCRARAILTDSLEPPPAYERPAALGGNGYKRSPAEVYEQILFHGPDLQGIREIVHLSDSGMVAGISAAPAPAAWMKSPLRKHWLSDPLVLDAAFQMASVWCFEKLGAVSLPSYWARYRQYCRMFPSDGVSAILEVGEATVRRMKGDFTFVDGQGRVVAEICGYEAVVDPSLYRAFKPKRSGDSDPAGDAVAAAPQKRAATG